MILTLFFRFLWPKMILTTTATVITTTNYNYNYNNNTTNNNNYNNKNINKNNNTTWMVTGLKFTYFEILPYLIFCKYPKKLGNCQSNICLGNVCLGDIHTALSNTIIVKLQSKVKT